MARSFEWDDAKAARNERLHGVSFAFARGVFDDAFAIEVIDDRFAYGEERCIITGQVENVVLQVVYTERGDRIRLISARRATGVERNEYFTRER